MSGVRRTRAPRDVRLKDQPDEVVECRDERHLFLSSDQRDERWRWPERDVIKRVNPCVRCKRVVRIKYIDENTGELAVPSKLIYRRGFLAPPGTGRIPKQAVRVEQALRFLERNPLPQKRANGPTIDQYDDYFPD